MPRLSDFLNLKLNTSYVGIPVFHVDGVGYEMEDRVDLSTEEVIRIK